MCRSYTLSSTKGAIRDLLCITQNNCNKQSTLRLRRVNAKQQVAVSSRQVCDVAGAGEVGGDLPGGLQSVSFRALNGREAQHRSAVLTLLHAPPRLPVPLPPPGTARRTREAGVQGAEGCGGGGNGAIRRAPPAK